MEIGIARILFIIKRMIQRESTMIYTTHNGTPQRKLVQTPPVVELEPHELPPDIVVLQEGTRRR